MNSKAEVFEIKSSGAEIIKTETAEPPKKKERKPLKLNKDAQEFKLES